MHKQRNFWDDRAEGYDKDISKHDKFYNNTVNSVRALLYEKDIVLDFGCGSGEYECDIYRFAKEIVAIDTSSEMISIANKKKMTHGLYNVIFKNSDLFDDYLYPGKFSVVLALNVLHLVSDLDEVLKRINSLLPSNGLFISQTPCLQQRGWLFRTIVNYMQQAKIAPSILNLTYSSLNKCIEKNGFQILESKIWNKKDAVQWVVAIKK